MHAPEIDAENILAFPQSRGLQNLFARQSAVGPDLDFAQPVIGIFKEEPLRSESNAEDNRGQDQKAEQHFGGKNEDAFVAVLGRLMRAHFDVEQMLLPTLPLV